MMSFDLATLSTLCKCLVASTYLLLFRLAVVGTLQSTSFILPAYPSRTGSSNHALSYYQEIYCAPALNINMRAALATTILLLWICLAGSTTLAFINPTYNKARSSKSPLYYSASDLLYEDQQKAKARRAAEEQRLLGDNIKPLLAPRKTKPAPIKRGSG